MLRRSFRGTRTVCETSMCHRFLLTPDAAFPQHFVQRHCTCYLSSNGFLVGCLPNSILKCVCRPRGRGPGRLAAARSRAGHGGFRGRRHVRHHGRRVLGEQHSSRCRFVTSARWSGDITLATAATAASAPRMFGTPT